MFSLLEVVWESGLIDWSIMQFSPFAFSHYTIPVENLSVAAFVIIDYFYFFPKDR
ncbi:hypothetical protein [Gracilibacillus alcaliphilus]|uniref:hypothetical protein n=1 Tax=Gracilibacillus alcaliphilus TaxID=1401441 RepID=UPI0019566AA2|nr:hypothetical protein [Gracilibacillus alcaliphilus]MBM7675291.1 hypothetical protein [Gracilibacillus alcaliphilus]